MAKAVVKKTLGGQSLCVFGDDEEVLRSLLWMGCLHQMNELAPNLLSLLVASRKANKKGSVWRILGLGTWVGSSDY